MSPAGEGARTPDFGCLLERVNKNKNSLTFTLNVYMWTGNKAENTLQGIKLKSMAVVSVLIGQKKSHIPVEKEVTHTLFAT